MHPKTTDLDSRVAISIADRIDKFTGKALVGQDWISKAIDRTERSVRQSISRLVHLGLLDITPGGGRGRVNAYRPLRSKPGTKLPGLAPQTRQITTLNPADYDIKPGTQSPPLPNRISK